MKYILNSLLIIVAATTSQAQEVIVQEDFTDGLPAQWTVYDGDSNIPASEVEEFTSAWIPYNMDGEAAMASTSFYTPSGFSADYLISNRIGIGSYSRLLWSAKSVDASYPETYFVLLSTTDSLPASFTDTIATVAEENALWNTRSVQLDLEGYSNQDIYIAFKNVTNDGFILLIDDFAILGSEFASITTPAPASISLFPNPVQNILNISSDQPVENVKIYNSTGQLVRSTNKHQVQTESLEKGIYITEISTSTGVFRQQFVKN